MRFEVLLALVPYTIAVNLMTELSADNGWLTRNWYNPETGVYRVMWGKDLTVTNENIVDGQDAENLTVEDANKVTTRNITGKLKIKRAD